MVYELGLLVDYGAEFFKLLFEGGELFRRRVNLISGRVRIRFCSKTRYELFFRQNVLTIGLYTSANCSADSSQSKPDASGIPRPFVGSP